GAFTASTGRSAPDPGFGTLASQFWPLQLLPWHPGTGSCSSTRKPASASRPLYADCYLPSTQVTDRFIPECERLRFWQCLKPFGASPRVCSRSSLECSPARISFGLLIQRSPPRLLNAAAWTGLGPAPESRPRGARPHLSRSLSPR